MKMHHLLLLIIPFLCISCTKSSKIIDLIGLNPIEYNEDKEFGNIRITVLYSKEAIGNKLFDLICDKLKNEYTKDKGYKIGEIYSPLEGARLYYAKKSTSSIFHMKNVGQPLSLFQIEANEGFSIILVYEFENHVGIHIASGR